MAVARWLVKYSGAGAKSGKYRSDMPEPTRNPWVNRSCQMVWLKEASAKPADMTRTPDKVMVSGDRRRRAQWRHMSPGVKGAVAALVAAGAQVPCSRRVITGLTRMPPAQVSP